MISKGVFTFDSKSAALAWATSLGIGFTRDEAEKRIAPTASGMWKVYIY